MLWLALATCARCYSTPLQVHSINDLSTLIRENLKRLKQLEKSIGASTVTAETINQALQWMGMCSTQHKICQQYQELTDGEDDLPLRLIDVDPKGEYMGDKKWRSNIDNLSCDKAMHACIRYSQDARSTDPNGVKYLTLSHRWDNLEPTVLTWETMTEFEEQIPVSNLSATFKDAIQITRCLGFRYIWIDSICINQADTVERASEISRMERIYRNSELNLSATTGETGLNLPRNPKSVLPIVQRTNISNSQDPMNGAAGYLVISGGPFETFVDLGPLNSRAWVLQERLLAPRVLHFCQNMVYWECPCLRASEVDSLGEMDYEKLAKYDDHRYNIKRNFAAVSMKADVARGHDNASWVAHLEPFYHVVRSYYFSTQLTYPHDRLTAISGIAKWFMARLGLPSESYLAGIWRETLPGCLLWSVYSLSREGATRDPEAAPSWSWASVITAGHLDLAFRYRDMVDPHPLFQDLHTVMIPKNGDRFTQLEVATLRLQVTVIPVERDWRNGASKMRLFGHNNWYTESHDFIIADPQPPILSFIRLKWDTTDILRADNATSPRRKLFMVPIAVAKGTTWLGGKCYRTPTIRGLILQRLPGKGQYKRVGMFMTGNLNDGCNPKLAQRIFQHLPMQSFTKFYEEATNQSESGWGPRHYLGPDGLHQNTRSGGSRTIPTMVGPDDHLGVNDDGQCLIEIL
ncbi:hypothetical protein CMUS01_10996 [Colletotrichum musicola]|uniref:Heterokaryon incompatibility domain-containing protein n=1 Tax=Colletotrichum musicola TaxID=2175873 RepID=A0A8H6K0R4_9PEZI|nr:hypothetical protein CMUS01_10996 [Colletotrichum musicola]